MLAPQRLVQCCRDRGNHHVEAHAYTSLAAGVGIDGVVQIRRKDEQRAVSDPRHDLISIGGGEPGDRWPNDAGLAARLVEIAGVGAVPGAYIVNGAQVIAVLMPQFST